MITSLFLRLLLLALLGGGAVSSAVTAGELVWDDVVIPANFVLDLGTGRVAGSADHERPVLLYQGGTLSSPVPLRALPQEPRGPRVSIERDAGEALPSVPALAGQELCFDLFTEGWGYLRVLEVTPHRVHLEYVRDPDRSRRRLVREPADLEAVSDPRGVTLRWPAQSGASYRIDRRLLPRRPFDPPGAWGEVATVEGTRWFDEDAPAGLVAEYRVSRTRPGGTIGWRARGVSGFAPEGQLLSVPVNARVDLLSGELDGERVDLTVQFVRATGVRILPGEGVQACLLSNDAEARWDTPADLCYAPPERDSWVPPGRVLALRLPEGALVRLRVEEVRGQEVTLGRQINLDGSPIFPPAPPLPEIRWEEGCGVLFEFEPQRQVPDGRQPTMVIEREATLDAGDWSVCLHGAPGELELIDPGPIDEVLVRYRFRQRLGERQLSPASSAIAVLVGDDGGPGGDLLLERAVADLGHRDYDRRGRARAVIVAMGERAWPKLGEALRSENPEVADAARELILAIPGSEETESSTGGGRAGLAQLLLGVHAAESGAGPPPTVDWVAAEPGARASAALRGAGGREVPAMVIEAWRRVLSEADPDQGVRLVALLAGQLEREGLDGDSLIGVLDPRAWEESLVDDDWSSGWLEPGARGGQESPWIELAVAQVRHDLAARRLESGEERAAAAERALLTLLLLSAHERTGDSLFLDGASRAIEDPAARLRGALDLARQRRAWDRFGDGGDPAETIVLKRADTALLQEALQDLESGGVPGTEIVLPSGVYEPLPGGAPLVLGKVGVRLRGEVGTELRCVLTMSNGGRAVLENLTLDPGTGIALNLMRASVRLVDCTVSGPNMGIFGSEAIVELERTTVLTPAAAPQTAKGIQLVGRSMLLARESRIETPANAIVGVRAVLLDRCVVLSQNQSAIDGGGDDDLWAVGCLLRGGGVALSRADRGLLDGVVLLDGKNRSSPIGLPMRVCAEHLHHHGDVDDFASEVWLGRCALGD